MAVRDKSSTDVRIDIGMHGSALGNIALGVDLIRRTIRYDTVTSMRPLVHSTSQLLWTALRCEQASHTRKPKHLAMRWVDIVRLCPQRTASSGTQKEADPPNQ